jgi:hypothetical protein
VNNGFIFKKYQHIFSQERQFKVWKDKGIKIALAYEDYDEKQKKDFDERFLQAQKPPRLQF